VSQLAAAVRVEPTACRGYLAALVAIAVPEVTLERRLTAGAECLRDACRQLMAQDEGARARDESPAFIA